MFESLQTQIGTAIRRLRVTEAHDYDLVGAVVA